MVEIPAVRNILTVVVVVENYIKFIQFM